MVTQEKEMAAWIKSIRKHTWNLTQKKLAELAGTPLATVRKFERTGKIELADFVKMAKALHAFHTFEAIIRGEEPETPQKIQKEKSISRLRDELALAKGEITPMELRKKNSKGLLNKPITKWRHNGQEKWMDAPNKNP